MRIGIDVGGTNTDAVLMDSGPRSDSVLAAVKAATTADVTSGIVAALDGLQERHAFRPADASKEIRAAALDEPARIRDQRGDAADGGRAESHDQIAGLTRHVGVALDRDDGLERLDRCRADIFGNRANGGARAFVDVAEQTGGVDHGG